ncbi:hypothetical protein [Nocardia cyriacigeorgica]|nr:hypothetical protein [Nocardia cyriacigeorgica]
MGARLLLSLPMTVAECRPPDRHAPAAIERTAIRRTAIRHPLDCHLPDR